MSSLVLDIAKPSVLLMGNETDPIYAKTGLGIAHWDATNCVGQIRFTPETVDVGLPDVTLGEALQRGAEPSFRVYRVRLITH